MSHVVTLATNYVNLGVGLVYFIGLTMTCIFALHLAYQFVGLVSRRLFGYQASERARAYVVGSLMLIFGLLFGSFPFIISALIQICFAYMSQDEDALFQRLDRPTTR